MKYLSLSGAICAIYGTDVNITSTRNIGGGDINDAACLTLNDGTELFVKSNHGQDVSFFEAEVTGLELIRDTDAISVPDALAVGEDRELGAFLVMKYIPSAQRVSGYWEDFAKRLYHMHTADTRGLVPGGVYGLAYDNYIGSNTQINTPHESWIGFYRDCRLIPRFEQAERYFDSGMKRKIDKLLGQLDKWLTEPDRPSLLHGDLWGGNAMTGSDGRAWLIDPAAYVGHAEADLSMTQLFGGFPTAFYSQYKALADADGITVLDSGYYDRRDLYNLYHLLNHLALFGRSYYGAVADIIEHYI